MIKKVYIENFQSHKSSELEFDKGVNVIIGESDSGKTSILRALKWAIFNRPGGEDFISNWGGECSATIELDNGTCISRCKGKHNKYELNDMEFLAFGQDVPDEIKSMLNMNDINIQQQMDSIFLLSKTSGEITAYFNKIAKLDKIDIGRSNIDSAIKKINQNISSSTSIIENKNKELIQFENLESLQNELDSLIRRETKLTEIQTKISKVSKLITSFENKSIEIKEKSKILETESLIDVLIELYTSQKEKADKAQRLKKIALAYFYKKQSIEKLEKKILPEMDIEELIKLVDKSKINRQQLINIRNLYKDITSNSEAQETTLKSISEKEKEYKKNFPEICPLCDTVLPHKH